MTSNIHDRLTIAGMAIDGRQPAAIDSRHPYHAITAATRMPCATRESKARCSIEDLVPVDRVAVYDRSENDRCRSCMYDRRYFESSPDVGCMSVSRQRIKDLTDNILTSLFKSPDNRDFKQKPAESTAADSDIFSSKKIQDTINERMHETYFPHMIKYEREELGSFSDISNEFSENSMFTKTQGEDIPMSFNNANTIISTDALLE